MRGVIFTELLELIEERFGYDLLDDVIDGAQLENDGAYAATGNYPFGELQRLVVALSDKSGLPVETLLEVYGEHLFGKLIGMFPEFNRTDDVLVFIRDVETYIHIEVKKLYPDAELPRFEILSFEPKRLELNYISSKNIPQLAKGLMTGASKHFAQPIAITFTPIDPTSTHFVIVRE